MLAFSFTEDRQSLVSTGQSTCAQSCIVQCLPVVFIRYLSLWNRMCLMPASGLSDSQCNTQLIFSHWFAKLLLCFHVL